MRGRVITFTVIHVAPVGWGPVPYGVVVVESNGARIVGRAESVDWLELGAEAEVVNGSVSPADV